ncbi:cob(I)yrinic acid a,c-diamide adenosyltransferase [Patescibacteria group bacterium]|nr:cob(I)yrinic acid a,c-diamide adenosyltransferase [Patescibacteria group bacterium]MBU2035991.1 cob(I)yrinic acid a,c-diamide adenosyltransferase [Patescibacteria group bacterium]
MPIYTKKGDKGQTDLFDSKCLNKIRVQKDDIRLQIIGSIDELNSCLGIISSLLKDQKEILFIEKIQKDLFLINSLVAGIKNIKFSKNKVKYLEEKIDFLEKKLPKLTNFVLPGGTEVSCFYHLARSITRRVERNIVSFSKENEFNLNVLVFINRLSDLFFILSRWSNYSEGIKETVWKK